MRELEGERVRWSKSCPFALSFTLSERLVSWLLARLDRSHRTGFDKSNLLVLSAGFFIWDEYPESLLHIF